MRVTWHPGLAATQGPTTPPAAPSFDDLLVLGARWVLVACAVWAVLVLAAAAVELLSGGRTRALTWVAAPLVVRRLVLAALGAALVGAPGSAALAAGPVAAGAAGPDGLPVPSRASVAVRTAPVPTPASARAAHAEQPRPEQPRPEQPRPEQPHVVVAPGDCLWDLARTHLPRTSSPTEVAAWVEHVHHLNAAVIGPDPDLLRVGQRLVLPPAAPSHHPDPDPSHPTPQEAP